MVWPVIRSAVGHGGQMLGPLTDLFESYAGLPHSWYGSQKRGMGFFWGGSGHGGSRGMAITMSATRPGEGVEVGIRPQAQL